MNKQDIAKELVKIASHLVEGQPGEGRGGRPIVTAWLNKHGLAGQWEHLLVDVPGGPGGGGGSGGSSEFYLKLEGLGNKHYLDASEEKDLVAWMKLTEKLFL